MSRKSDLLTSRNLQKGNSEFLTRNESRRIKLVNSISIISFTSILIFVIYYSIIDFALLKTQIFLLSVFSVGALIPLLLNHFTYHQLAKIIIACYDSILILGFIFFFGGKELGSHTLFLIFSIIPIFIWSAKEKYFIVFFYTVNILLFIFIEFFPVNYTFPMQFPEKYISFSNGITILISFLVTSVAIIIFHRLADKKEALLFEKNIEIEKQKTATSDLNKELNKKVRELSNSKKELEEANIIQNKIYSIIAHDLRNPASSITGLLKVLVEEYQTLSEKQKQYYLQLIYQSSNTSYKLLENLLDWSLAQTNKISVKPEKISLKNIVDEILSHFKVSVQEKNIHIENKITPDLLAYADRYLLSTVLRNLISNAIKFTIKQGEISISTRIENKSKVFILVKDSGVGMSPGELNKLKRIGGNLVKPGTENEKGTGLGLMICKEFVELNGGNLSIESAKGKGSTFSFSVNSVPE